MKTDIELEKKGQINGPVQLMPSKTWKEQKPQIINAVSARL